MGAKGEGQGSGKGNWTWMVRDYKYRSKSVFQHLLEPCFGDAKLHEHLPSFITQSLALAFPSGCFVFLVRRLLCRVSL